MSRSTFYYYIKHPIENKYQAEKKEVAEIFAQHKGRYGYRRILMILRSRGYLLNHKTVQKLMKSLNLKGKQRKNDKYHSYKGQVGEVADNHLNRELTSLLRN